MAKLFGTDGVRGVANTQLDPELAVRLGRAAALDYTRVAKKRPLILVGADTRASSDMLQAALSAGLCSGGADVLSLGVVTTPAVAHLVKDFRADGGAMISASHNAYLYNGIKFFSGAGTKLTDDREARIERTMNAPGAPRITGGGLGHIKTDSRALDYYVEYLCRAAQRNFRGLKVVIDCANGAASEISPRVFRRLGAQVYPIFNLPDGVNINEGCGSTNIETLQKAVVEHEAHVGLAHDGDADRLIAVDEHGEVVDGDGIMAVCGLHLLRKGALNRSTLVATVMSNMGLDVAFRKAGGRVIKTQVGDRYVLERMRREGLNLGGEQSGHIVFGDIATTGDGILTGIMLLGVMKETAEPLSRLAGQLETFPQVLVNAPITRPERFEGNSRISLAIGEIEDQLGVFGRVLVRLSGTEPLVRVMIEADDMNEAERFAQQLLEVVRQELG